MNWIGALPDGSMSWNGVPTDAKRIGQYLGITMAMLPRPGIVLNRLPATSCDTLGQAAATVERGFDCTPDLCLLAVDGVPESPPPAPSPPPSRN